jgi:hypothetical protein
MLSNARNRVMAVNRTVRGNVSAALIAEVSVGIRTISLKGCRASGANADGP